MRKTKKKCKAQEGTEKLRKAQQNFRDFLKEIRQSAIEEQKKDDWFDFKNSSKHVINSN